MADRTTTSNSAAPAASHNASTLSELYRRGGLTFSSSDRGDDSGSGSGNAASSPYDSASDISDTDSDTEYYLRVSDAQAQWDESLRQLEQLLTFVLVPVVGKFLGRRFAYFRKYYLGRIPQFLIPVCSSNRQDNNGKKKNLNEKYN